MRELLMRGDDHENQSSCSNVVRRRNEEEEEGGERDRVFRLYLAFFLSLLRAYSSDKRVFSNTSFLYQSPVAELRMTLSL